MIADNIKLLREAQKMTQAELAKRMGITRSSVNAWEMGISVPSTQYLVELSQIFKVSTDFILGLKYQSAVDVTGLSEEEISIVVNLVTYFKNHRQEHET